jgi:uncharacterized membrane protein YsdA (DUF1294 family)
MKQANRGGLSLLAAAAFLGLIGVCVLAGKIPLLIFGSYLVVSAIAFAAYALDKSAARNNRWRIRESTLHFFSLAGGWPGALCAQSILRHKCRKASFQAMFWVTVVVHCGVLAWLLSPYGIHAIRAIL